MMFTNRYSISRWIYTLGRMETFLAQVPVGHAGEGRQRMSDGREEREERKRRLEEETPPPTREDPRRPLHAR